MPSENGVVTSLSLIVRDTSTYCFWRWQLISSHPQSGAGDEIIWELTTNNDSAAQTAYFYLGDVANCESGWLPFPQDLLTPLTDTTLTNVTVSNRTAFHD